MGQVKWFDRSFDFSTTQNIFPSLLERLRGTPARVEERFRDLSLLLSPAQLARRVDDTWSIKENLGHLSDLEPLWQQRLDDIVTGKIELSPTDLQNARTMTAGHNEVPVEELLGR